VKREEGREGRVLAIGERWTGGREGGREGRKECWQVEKDGREGGREGGQEGGREGEKQGGRDLLDALYEGLGIYSLWERLLHIRPPKKSRVRENSHIGSFYLPLSLPPSLPPSPPPPTGMYRRARELLSLAMFKSGRKRRNRPLMSLKAFIPSKHSRA